MSTAAVVVLGGLLLPACSSAGSPAAPSASEQVAGTWATNTTLTSATGGECVNANLVAAVGSRDIAMLAVQQTGSSLTATVTSEGNGTRCAFTGSVGGGTMNLSLASCQAGRITGFSCGSGGVRDLQLVSEGISGTVNQLGNGMGTDTSTWNVLASGSTVPVGVLTLNATFAWVQLGLPSSDFHNFTGTIAPGYQDGVITIGPPEPFCEKCGWFR